MTETTDHTAYADRLAEFVGRTVVPRRKGPDAVNLPMIRHWVHAMEDENPIHLDEQAARETGRAGIVAPATMVQAFTMPTYTEKMAVNRGAAPASGMAELFAVLDEGGYTSVVATDSDYEFHRELVLGDEVHVEEVVESISDEKVTGLGAGRFITTLRTYTDGEGEVVATQRWRLLKFTPKAAGSVEPAAPAAGVASESSGASPADAGPDAGPMSAPDTAPGLRPRPGMSLDTAFWWEAAAQRRLVIQRCAACHDLRHPPSPSCPHCGSFDWDTIEASGRGTLYSFVVGHHPKLPGFDYPLLVALVELEEGTRLVTNLVGVADTDVEIGMPLALEWIEDGDLTLPAFRAAPSVESEDH